MKEDRHHVVPLELERSHSEMLKNALMDLTLTACLAEIEMKFQYPGYVWCTILIAKTVTVTVTP